jgi:hypothetical protein
MTANRIIQHIFQAPEIKQVEESALEQLVTAYPYFTTARLLLARKQYISQRNLLAPAVKKAQLYSTNMHYFYRFITSVEPVAAPEPAEPAIPEKIEEPVIIPEPEPVIEEPVAEPEPEPVVEELPVIEEPALSPEAIYEEPVIYAEPELEPIPEPVLEELPVIEEPTVSPEAIYEEPVILTEPKTVPVVAESGIYVAPPAVIEVTVNKDMADTTVNNHTADEHIKIFPLEMNNTEDTLTYQPLYTDDYFAYKRLKDPEEAEVINEKGASEMKSFTSWLKDIKSTFSEKSTKQQYHQQLTRSYEDFDPEVSEAVEKMAMESITLTDDVVSETLAEIWARQRQYQTAIHIYQKLSLLNPNKSAYFAQKIQEIQLLKDNN